jgi:hypothetical protein
MNPDPSISISWDYLVELCDDGERAGQQDDEIIVLPPTSPGAQALPTTSSTPGPQP